MALTVLMRVSSVEFSGTAKAIDPIPKYGPTTCVLQGGRAM